MIHRPTMYHAAASSRKGLPHGQLLVMSPSTQTVTVVIVCSSGQCSALIFYPWGGLVGIRRQCRPSSKQAPQQTVSQSRPGPSRSVRPVEESLIVAPSGCRRWRLNVSININLPKPSQIQEGTSSSDKDPPLELPSKKHCLWPVLNCSYLMMYQASWGRY